MAVPETEVSRDQYDPDCTRCPRLAAHLAAVREKRPDYHALPVPPFGDPEASLLIVGLAPGMHGANRSGRPFTGDFAGILLYRALYDAGFASRPESVFVDDGLELTNCRITNAVKCLPPQNKPTTAEVDECSPYLQAELGTVGEGGVVLALGSIAHRAVLKAFSMKLNANGFGHGAEHALPGGLTLLDSYHCSRYNTQTRRLTEEMFHAVIGRARELVGG
ncbi:uracil-DNA glycosylase [Lentisalinibacter salinarum]|uniref:uracil-DNA glycosylase n=1 Tax=Lentisalinibacter salinarum TaxID=2992239 RepID=UPI00386D7FD6